MNVICVGEENVGGTSEDTNKVYINEVKSKRLFQIMCIRQRFFLDFNNALCLNFGFSYFLSFCAGSFFMVITLIFKLNNCVICTQAKMGFI